MQFLLIRNTIFLSSLIVALSACGGGGSNDKPASAPIPVTSSSILPSNSIPDVVTSSSGQAAAVSSLSVIASSLANTASSGTSNISSASSVTVVVSSSSETEAGSNSSAMAVSSSFRSSAISSSTSSISVIMDTQPDAFNFVSVANVVPGATVVSAAITIAGINTATAIHISGGQYAIGDGAYTGDVGTAINGQTITVKATASAIANTTTSATLTLADVSATFSVTTLADIAAPTVQIMFPTPVSTTNGKSVLMRGTAKDNLSKITSVKVNGIVATSQDDFSNWQVRVPLILGVNTLVVSTQDSANNIVDSAAAINVTRTITLGEAKGIAMDKVHNRALMVDGANKAVVAIDLSTGVRSLISENDGAAYSLTIPEGIVLDAANNRALVIDIYRSSLVAIDLTSGVRSILNSNNCLFQPKAIALDTENHLALVLDANALRVVDLVSGTCTVLSDVGSIDDLTHLGRPGGIAYDATHKRALVVNTSGSIIAIDASSGVRKVLSNESIPNSINRFSSPSGITLDATGNRALVMDRLNVVAVDLESGARTIVSNFDLTKTLFDPIDIAIDSDNRALVLDTYSDALISVDLNNGARSILSENAAFNTVNPLLNPRAVSVDAANNRVLVLNGGNYPSVPPSLVTVDLSSSIRTVLSNNSIPDAQNGLISPTKMILDSPNNRAFVIDTSLGALIVIDLSSGQRRVLARKEAPEMQNIFSDEYTAIALDSSHNRVLVAAHLRQVVLAIDLDSGAGTVLSSNVMPDAVSKFQHPHDIAFDIARNRALVLDVGSLLAVDLASGARTAVASQNWSLSTVMMLDNENDSSWFLSGNGNIVSVNLSSGKSTSLPSNNDLNSLVRVSDLAVDAINRRAFVGDSYRNAIVLLDLVTGERVYFSK